MVQNKNTDIYEVKRKDWVTDNKEQFGTLRPPLRALNIKGVGELTVYPALIRGHIEMFGPPLLPVLWIPEFMCLSPLDPLNVLHFVYVGNLEDLRIESINGDSVPSENVKKNKYPDQGEVNYFVLIPPNVVKSEILKVEISFRGEKKVLEFEKKRATSWFPMVAPL